MVHSLKDKIIKIYNISFSKQVISTFGAQFINLALGVLHAIILSRWLGPEGKGITSLALLVPQMAGMFFCLGINISNVYMVGKNIYNIKTLSSASTFFAIIITLFSVIFFYIITLIGWTEKLLPGISLGYLEIFFFSFPLTIFINYYEGILQGLRKISDLNVISLIQIIVLVVLDVLLIVILKFGIIGAAIANNCAMMIRLLLVIIRLSKNGGCFYPKITFEVGKDIFFFGIRGQFGNIFQFFNYRLDTFFLNYFTNPADVGIYSVSVRIAELLWNFPRSVAFVMFSKSARTNNEELKFLTPRVFQITFIITFLGALFLVALGKPIILLLFGPNFVGSYIPFLVLLIGVIPLGCTKVLTSELAGRGFPHINSISSGAGLFMTIFLDFLLIPKYGILGAAVASSIAYSTSATMSLLFYRHVVGGLGFLFSFNIIKDFKKSILKK